MSNSESTVQIIPYYAHPHVHTVIIDNTFYEETVADRTDPDARPYSVAIVTGADTGIDNTFVRLTSLKTKRALFGKGNFQKYGQSSIQADVLFNPSTAVWFCRVLPDNATYSHVVFLAHYRKGKILDDLGQETGKVRMEVKFSTSYVTKPAVTSGPVSDEVIEEYARTLIKDKADPQTGYLTVPICYVRSIGRGNYGNNYSMSIQRDKDAEKEYSMKMYKFSLVNNDGYTRVSNIFSGSLYQTVKYGMSTLISDVLDQYATGSCPVYIYPFEDSFETLFNFYEDIVIENGAYVQGTDASDDDIAEYEYAANITHETFDPLFGYKLNTRTNEQIPYYRNYTVLSTGEWVEPDITVAAAPTSTSLLLGASRSITSRPMNTADWPTAYVGARVLMVADPLNDGYRWLYTVTAIDVDSGNIVYDEGYEVEIDADQYDGTDITMSTGQPFIGGGDGDFESITVDGVTRAPNDSEMKLLLSKEYVRAFRGQKDRKILSPARVDLDFIFDANYNLTDDEYLTIDTNTPLYVTSTILTNEESQKLAVSSSMNATVLEFADLNVKGAIYDLNEFRNKNGMTVNQERGAGCSIYLDCGLMGNKGTNINNQLSDIIQMMETFDGRATSIDLGFYEIFDPVTGKRIKVTTSYFLAQNLVPHIMTNGLNKPFTYGYASLYAIQRTNAYTVTGNMIRDSFRPDIDLIDWDVKEQLYTSRINYYLTSNEGRKVERACQNTRQREASALLEENNVRVLNTLKKGLERACRGYLYEWNEPTARKAYTKTQMEIYKPWIGTMVQDLDIKFDANEWEQERMIMHCYCVVKFRDIVKRIILEINIQRPDYSQEGDDE